MTGCDRAGCGGHIEDGFCDECGLAPLGVGVVVEPPAVPSVRTAAGTMPWRSGTAAGSTRSARASRRARTERTRRGQLGVGLVDVPAVPYRDAAAAVLENPEVAEHKRFCAGCGAAVGRGRDGRPSRTEGYCAGCGEYFSFVPTLAKGDIVAGQYEVFGCLAHGGLGWIYLARDRNVSDRWVVLKGLLNTGDRDALAAALAERRFLAEAEHPNVVRIYNFVQHFNERTNSAIGYIVMEYVGGQSLRDLLRDRRRADGPAASLPLAQVIAYGIEGLRALGYLHGLGLVYCDFKPDNMIQTEEQVKLIDLGAVRRADDESGSVWGTIGYQAPEVPVEGPSVVSDLYTVGRTLAVLSFSFDFAKRYADRLPDVAEVPLLVAQPSFARVLLRATDPDPDRRFGSAEEMSRQLVGVLREVLSEEDGRPRPSSSTLFAPEHHVVGPQLVRDPSTADLTTVPPADLLAHGLPLPQVDATDPAAGLLATLATTSPADLVRALHAAPTRTPEVRMRLIRAHLEIGDEPVARKLVAELAADEPDDWRVDYYGGICAFTGGRLDQARAAFDEVYGALPGEAAPKLALAAVAERAGNDDLAARFYRLVWRTDPSYVGAAFGLARALLRSGRRAESIEVLDSVPVTSSHHAAAQVAAVLTAAADGRTGPAGLAVAAGRIAGLDLDAARAGRLAIEVLTAALTWVQSRPAWKASGRDPRTLLGSGLTERELRLTLEHRYRTLARLADDLDDRIALVDKANAIRPRTLV